MLGRMAGPVAVPLLAVWLLGACSGSDVTESGSDLRDQVAAQPVTTEPWSEFCGGAVGLVEYLDASYVSLFDPGTAAGFLAGAEERLAALEGFAPVEISADVTALRGAYVELDRLLSAADYDVAGIDNEALLAEIDTQASLNFDNYLTTQCGFGSIPQGDAPQVLTDEELSELLDDGPATVEEEAQLDLLLSSMLTSGSGLDAADADCVVAGLSIESKDTLLAGGLSARSVPAGVADEFARSLADCGVDSDLETLPLDGS
jgi:hypothetical protein